MGISGVSPAPKPVPKATCPGCRRPIVLLKSDRCLYCGAATGQPAAAFTPASRLPAEALIALEPRPVDVSASSKWLRRGIALGFAGLLTAIVVLLCMKG
jgi:hypothetical protein